jgi:hypothetical protein
MSYWSVLDDLSTDDELLDPDELHDRIRQLADASGGLIQRREIGLSEQGRPIELVTLGEGDRSALIVGAPHPNEPIGCVTILRMIELLIRRPMLSKELGFRWSFIPCIEPDGLMLNQGWLKGPRTPERYLEHFYRPPLDLQAEYTFELNVEEWQFNRPTHGNRAWSAALEETRPDLLVSLHNAEYGGVFYMLSRAIAGLAEDLVRDPGRAGLGLNRFGDPSMDAPPIRPGVFPFLDIPALIRQARAAGRNPGALWPAGESSAGYAAARYGTFSMVLEVPYWDDSALKDEHPSGQTLRQVMAELKQWNRENAAQLGRSLERLTNRAGGAGQAFSETLREAQALAERGIELPEAALARDLTVAEWSLLVTTLRLFSLRSVALLARLADIAGAKEDAAEARMSLATAIGRLRSHTSFGIVPLRNLVRLQASAILTGASALATGLA